MAVVRPRQRKAPWFLAALTAGVIVVVLGLVALTILIWVKPHPEPSLSAAIENIQAELDVLTLSLYTYEVVQNGQISSPSEYDAALATAERVRKQWQDLKGHIPDNQWQEIDRNFAQLVTDIEARVAPNQVRQVASALQRELQQVTR